MPIRRSCLLLLLLAACSPGPANQDAGHTSGTDAGAPDGGAFDASVPDSGIIDAGADAGAPDAGPIDGGQLDGGSVDAGELDAGHPDAGTLIDAGPPDAGTNPVPELTSIAPSSATVDTSALVTLTGVGFVSGAFVTFNGLVEATTVVSATTATAELPAMDLATAGTYPVAVTNPAPGGGTSASLMFTVENPTPAVSSVTPTSVLVGSDDTVVALTGQGFLPSTTATINGTPATPTVSDASDATLTIPAAALAAAGVIAIAVVNAGPGGGTSNVLDLSVDNPGPTLSAISPSSAVQGSSDTTITLTGAGFVSTTVVSIGSTPLATTYVSSTSLTALIPAASLMSPGLDNITVSSPSPGGGTSGGVAFTVIALNPLPVLTSLNPASLVVGSAPQLLTLGGSGFVAGATCTFNGSSRATTVTSPSTATIQLTAADLATTGTEAVTITNPSPGGGTSDSVAFTVANPMPAVTSLTPSSVIALSPTQTVTIDGSGFVATSVVDVDGSPRDTTFVSATELTASFLASDFAAAGTLTVTVVNAPPGGGTSAGVGLAVPNPAPSILSISPTGVLQGASDTTLTVTGSDFVSGAQVMLDDAGLSTTFVSSTSLTAVIPASAEASVGTHSITVANPSPGGGASSALSFSVSALPNPVPTLGALSPSSAVVGAAPPMLTAQGSNFVPGATITFNGTARATTVVSDTEATTPLLTADLADAWTVEVTIANPTPGGGVSSSLPFTIENPAPVLTSISPSSVIVGSGAQSIVLTGSGFVRGSVVDVDGAGISSTFESSTSLAIQMPAAEFATTTTHSITVTNASPGGGTSGAVIVTVVNPVPVLTSINPGSLIQGTGTAQITLAGSDFVSGSGVVLDGSTSLTTVFESSTALTASVPASITSNAGTHTVTVANPLPGGGTSSGLTLTIVAPNPVPNLMTLSPSSVSAGSGAQTLTLGGSGFVTGATVTFNGATCATTVVSATDATIQLAASDVTSVGTALVSITNPAPGGGTSANLTFTVDNPAPVITSIGPATIAVGSSGQQLTVNGSGFVASSTIDLDGAPLTTSFVGASQLTTQLSSSLLASSATHTVTVVNATPGGGTSGSATLTIANPLPTLSSISPSSIVQGTATTVTVSGTAFVAGAEIVIGGTLATATFISSTSVSTSLPPSVIDNPGTYSVSVTNPGPGGGTTAPAMFTVVAPNPLPVLTSLSPASVLAGSSAQTLTLQGQSFVSGASVTFNGTPRTTTVVSATEATVQLTSADVAVAGTASVTVANPTPGGGGSATLTFTIDNPVPVVSSIAPSTVTVGSTGQQLTVNGSGFVSGSTIELDGTPLTTSFVAASQLTTQLSSSVLANTGTHTITVVNATPGGGTSGGLTLTVANPVPTLTSISPASTVEGTATTLTVAGTGFVIGAQIIVGVTSLTTTVISSTSASGSLPSSIVDAPGAYSVSVENPGPGGGTSGSATFTVVAPNPMPTLTALSPSSVLVGSGSQTLTLDGTGFASGASATFNGSPRTTTVTSSSVASIQLTTADVASAATISVSITNPTPGGGTSGTLTFAVNNPAPSISSISPSSVVEGSAAQFLTVEGTGFVSTSVIRVNGAPLSTTLSAGALTATLPASDFTSTGSLTITVFNATPGGGTSTGVTLSVTAPPPTITALSPCGTVAGGAAFTLDVTGTGFVSGATVTFNGTSLSATVSSATALSVTVPASAFAIAPSSDLVDVSVSASGSASNNFTFGLAKSVSTLSGNVQPIFSTYCAGCHFPGGDEGMDLTSGDSYASIVGVASEECFSPSRNRIQVCGPSPDQSYIVAKVSGTDICVGSQMPLGGSPLSAAQVQTIMDWIAQGAPR